MNVYDEIKKVFDAKFTPEELEKHYKLHTDPNTGKTQLPKGMTKEQYAKKAEEVSLKKIDPITSKNRKVRAAKRQTGEVAKTDGKWFVTYTGGKFGRLITAYPASEQYFENDIKAKGAKEEILDINI